MCLYRATVKKGPIPAAYLVLFKNATFDLTKYEPFFTFIMAKHTSDVNDKPYSSFTFFLQLPKVRNFAS